jgi:hypothetical protein
LYFNVLIFSESIANRNQYDLSLKGSCIDTITITMTGRHDHDTSSVTRVPNLISTMIKMPPYAAVLLALTASPGSAFLQVGPLYNNKIVQRGALLAERVGTNSSPTGGYLSNLSPTSPGPTGVVIETPKKQDNEKFQRALLEAKLAYDAIAAATTAVAEVVDETVPSPLPPPSAVIAAEPVPAEPEPVLLVEPTEVVSTVIATTTPEPEIQKPVIISNKRENKVVSKQSTEFTVPRELAIVPINESTVQFTAGALGGAAGLIVGGPILGIITASVFNYLSRKEEDKSAAAAASTAATTSPKKIVDTASQTALLAYNYVAQFEKKNKIVDSIFKFLERMTDKAKEADTPAAEALVTLETTLGGIANKVEELNDDYDIVGGVGTVLDSIGDLVEISVDKVVELNDEYKFTNRAVDAVKVVVGKVAEKK